VIDLDSVRIGDPAEDVGRLLASIWWDTEPGSREAVRDSLVAGYGPGEIGSRRLAGWTTLAMIRQAARRVPVLDPALGERMIELLRTLPPP
jgi:aminoglycoside phosphotransferase (APT) family kinase protein